MQSQVVNKAIDWISEQDERFNVEIFMLLDGQERGSWVRAKAIQDLGKAIEIDYETTGIVPKRIKQVCSAEAVKSARLTEIESDDLPF